MDNGSRKAGRFLLIMPGQSAFPLEFVKRYFSFFQNKHDVSRNNTNNTDCYLNMPPPVLCWNPFRLSVNVLSWTGFKLFMVINWPPLL